MTLQRIYSADEIENFRDLAEGDADATIAEWRTRFQSPEVNESQQVTARNLPIQNDLTPIVEKRIEAMPSTFQFTADQNLEGSDAVADSANAWAAGAVMEDGRDLFGALEEIYRDQEVDGAAAIVMSTDETGKPILAVRDVSHMSVETDPLRPRLVTAARFEWEQDCDGVSVTYVQEITKTSQTLSIDGKPDDVTMWEFPFLPVVIIPRNLQKSSPLGTSALPPLIEAYLSVLNALAWLNLTNKYSGKIWCPDPASDDGWALPDQDGGGVSQFRIVPAAFHPIPLKQVGSDSQPTGILEQYREALAALYRLGKVRKPGSETADMRSGKAMIVDTLELLAYVDAKMGPVRIGLAQIADMYAWLSGEVTYPQPSGIFAEFPDGNDADPQEQRERAALWEKAAMDGKATTRQMYAGWQANGMLDQNANPDDYAAEVEEAADEQQAGAMASAVRRLQETPAPAPVTRRPTTMAKRPTSNILRLRALAKVSDDLETPEAVLLETLIRGHAMLLGDVEDGEIALVAKRMKELQDTLAARAVEMMEVDGDSRSLKKLNTRIGQLKAMRSRGLRGISDDIEAGAIAASSAKSTGIAGSVAEVATEFEIGAGFGVLSPQQLRRITQRDFLGAKIPEWIKAIDVSGDFVLEREMRASFFAGDSIPQAAERLRGIVAKDANEAVTVARTVINGAANEAAVETYRENADVLDGMIWVATLDSRICEECMSLDGEVFPVDSTTAPPAHPNCRCFMAPSVKGFPKPEVPTAKEWFSRQSETTQARVLGKGRASLINRSGSQVGLSDVFRRDGGFRNTGDLQRLSARRKAAAATKRRGKRAA